MRPSRIPRFQPVSIPKRYVREYLNRELDDWRWMKTISLRELQDLRDKWCAGRPPIWKKLRKEQRIYLLLMARLREFMVLADTGIGKSLLSIATARYFKKYHGAKRTLVLMPYTINKGEWEREVLKHSPETTFTTLEGTTEEKWAQLEGSNSTLVFETYGGLVRMCCIPERKKGKRKTRLVPDKKLVRRLCNIFAGLVMDESNLVASRDALISRICRQVAKKAIFKMGLTGTVFGKDPTPMFGQFFIVDGGKTLGPTLGLFRAAFFNERSNGWGGFEHTFRRSMSRNLHNTLQHRSLRYRAEETTLPKAIEVQKYVQLPKDAEAYYAQAKEAIRLARGDYYESKNTFLRMRQIASGFVGFKDDETGARAKVRFKNNPKLELLRSLVEEIAPHDKIVIFHDFIYSGDMIVKELKEAKIGHVTLYGKKAKGYNPRQLLERFDKDDECRVFVTNQSGAYGLNLQVAKYAIFFESPVRAEVKKQMRRRVERQGTKHDRVFLYDLITEGTADHAIFNNHRLGGNLFEMVIEGNKLALLDENS